MEVLQKIPFPSNRQKYLLLLNPNPSTPIDFNVKCSANCSVVEFADFLMAGASRWMMNVDRTTDVRITRTTVWCVTQATVRLYTLRNHVGLQKNSFWSFCQIMLILIYTLSVFLIFQRIPIYFCLNCSAHCTLHSQYYCSYKSGNVSSFIRKCVQF